MTTYSITHCRGIEQGCPYLITDVSDPGDALDNAIMDSGWPELLRTGIDGEPKPHQQLRIVLAGCANACSRPQIADVGLIRAGKPAIDAAVCSGCGACADTCPEGAIRSRGETCHMDTRKCLFCLRCREVCPEGALTAEETGYRVLVGGRLGRRPVLARELSGLYSPGKVLDLLSACLDLLLRRFVPGIRLGDLVRERPREMAAELDAACTGAALGPPRPGRAASITDGV